MLSTIGAVILAVQTTTSMYFTVNAPIKITETLSPIPYKQNPVLVAVVDYYNTKGEWAGTFKIDNIIKFKVLKYNETEAVAHVKYHYTPIPNNAKNMIRSGYDKRIFMITDIKGKITVTKMGTHNSANF